ncbi:hypothetical protein ACF0H5_009484 [Mactra antiquata]
MVSKISSKPININPLDIPKFKRKSNEEQYKINAKVVNKLTDVESALESQSIDTAKECLIEAKELLKKRQKLIQLADSSELGWKVWKAAPFWPLICDVNGRYKSFIKDVVELPNVGVVSKGSGVGLRNTLKRKFEEAGVGIDDNDYVINRMATHVLASRADNTVSKYSQQLKHFNQFCNIKGFANAPAHSIHVAMYLSSLIDC